MEALRRGIRAGRTTPEDVAVWLTVLDSDYLTQENEGLRVSHRRTVAPPPALPLPSLLA
jgi:hypothetical protein